MHTEEVARIAVLAAVRYHREKKDNNGDVSCAQIYVFFFLFIN